MGNLLSEASLLDDLDSRKADLHWSAIQNALIFNDEYVEEAFSKLPAFSGTAEEEEKEADEGKVEALAPAQTKAIQRLIDLIVAPTKSKAPTISTYKELGDSEGIEKSEYGVTLRMRLRLLLRMHLAMLRQSGSLTKDSDEDKNVFGALANEPIDPAALLNSLAMRSSLTLAKRLRGQDPELFVEICSTMMESFTASPPLSLSKVVPGSPQYGIVKSLQKFVTAILSDEKSSPEEKAQAMSLLMALGMARGSVSDLISVSSALSKHDQPLSPEAASFLDQLVSHVKSLKLLIPDMEGILQSFEAKIEGDGQPNCQNGTFKNTAVATDGTSLYCLQESTSGYTILKVATGADSTLAGAIQAKNTNLLETLASQLGREAPTEEKKGRWQLVCAAGQLYVHDNALLASNQAEDLFAGGLFGDLPAAGGLFGDLPADNQGLLSLSFHNMQQRIVEPPTRETSFERPAPPNPYQYGPKISSGDIITVELNLTKGTLGFYRNQVFLGLAFGPEGSGATLTGKIGGGSSYFPAVSLKNKGDSVQFIKKVISGSATELLLPQTKIPSPFKNQASDKDPLLSLQSSVNYIESLSKRQIPKSTVSKHFVEEIKKRSTVTLPNTYMTGSASIEADVQVPGAIALVLKFDKSAQMGLKDSIAISAPTVPEPIVFKGVDGSTINYSNESSDGPELKIGDKVVRGSSWDRSEEDGGIGAIGTVAEIYKVKTQKYKVVGGNGAMVRKTPDLDSPEVKSIAQGEVVEAADVESMYADHPLVRSGRRVRLVKPVTGYASLHTESGQAILTPEATVGDQEQSKVHPKAGEPCLVDVQWKETGKTETKYRWGVEGKYDLQIIESHKLSKPIILKGDSLHIHLEPSREDGAASKPDQGPSFLKLSEEDKMIVPLIENFEDKGPFTVEAWVRPEAPSREVVGEAAIFSRYADLDGLGLRIFCLGRKADGTLRLRMMNAAMEEGLNIEGGSIEVGQWSHVAMAVRSDSNACAILVNGKEVASGSFAGGERCDSLGSHINIGGSDDPEYIGFCGHIYDVRLWGLGLCQEEINSCRNSLPAPTEDSLFLNLALTDSSETNAPKNRVEGSDLTVELIGGAWEDSIPHPTQIELKEKNCKLTVEPVFSTEALTDGELFKEEHELFCKIFNAGDHHHDLAVASYMNAVAKAKDYSVSQMCSIKWSEISPTQEDLVRNRKLNELVEMGSTLEVKEGWPSPIEARFKTIQELNMLVQDLIKLIDFSVLEKPWSLAATLVGLKGLILEAFKQELWTSGLTETKQDSGGYELKISRSRAAKHARNGGVDHDGRFSVFGQVFRQIHPKPATQLRRTQVNKGEFVQLYTVTFMGERSHDAGGPYRESWSMYAQELMSTSVPMLIRTPNGRHSVGYNRDKWMPHPGSTSTTHMEMFTFLGKLMGMAIRTKAYLAINFAPACWKLLLGEKLNSEDLESIDHMLIQSINSLKNIEQQGIDADTFEDVIFEVFTTLSTDDQTIELKSNGANIPVTFDTRHEYANAVLNYRLHEFDKQIAAIRNGLGMVVPLRSMALFSAQELETQVCGSPEFDLKLLKSATSYSSISESDQHVKFFWEAMESFTNEERCMFLRFTWGRSRLPLTRDDFAQQFTLINFNSSPADQYYPVAHTCFFQLELPRYSTLDIMKEKLRYAIYNCQEIDGDETGVGMAAAAMGWEE